MTQSEVKKRAEEFCRVNDINSYPVKIVNLCNRNGLKVFEEYMDPTISGLVVVDEELWEKYGTNQFICVNLTELAVRRRFTIAHELAHFILHRNGNKLYAHRDMTDANGVRSSIEREANYFAANILMPEKLVKEHIDFLKQSVRGKIPGFVLVKEIADNFLVSESAAEVRLKQIGII